MKIVTCPIPRWAGTAQISDPMTVMQVAVIERAISSAQKIENPTTAEVEQTLLPGVLACVNRFDLANLPAQMSVEQWPGTPRGDSILLFNWLLGEVRAVYRGEVTPPPLA